MKQKRTRGKDLKRRSEASATEETASLDKHEWKWRWFNQIVLVFAIGCVFGTYYEEIITLVKGLWENGTLEWFSRRGLVYGPFSPIYGVGAVGIYLMFYQTKAKWLTCLVGGALAGGVFEYLASVLQEWVFATRSWDYSDRFLNIGGRTTIPYMVFWGILVVFTARWLYPTLNRAYGKLVGRGLNMFCMGLAIFLIFDIGMSLAANWRQAERREGGEAENRLDEFFDEHFPDERLKKVYENTEYVGE